MAEQWVELFGWFPFFSGRRRMLDDLYNPKIGVYLAPVLPEGDPTGVKKLQEKGLTGRGVRTAILDTGLMSHHPWIRDRIDVQHDFTGEGVEDQNGHGTAVALELLLVAHDTKLVNVKIVPKDGRGRPELLVQGLRWAAEQGVATINASLGIFRDECCGDCDVCSTAEEVASRSLVVAAAGNKAGTVSCPAKVGLLKKEVGVIAVGACDPRTSRPLENSGMGQIYGPGIVRYAPLRQ